MSLTLMIVGFILLIYNVFSEGIITKIFRKKYNFNHQVFADVLCYIGEILVMFGFFHMFITELQSVIKYNEPSMLKMFIDFFTVYQIGVLVILKLINASSIREYKKQLAYVETIRYRSNVKVTLKPTVETIQVILEGHLPPDIERRYKKIVEISDKYEDVMESEKSAEHKSEEIQQEVTEFMNFLNAVLDSMAIKINSEIETLSNEWEASWVLRRVRLKIQKAQELKQAKIEEAEIRDAEEKHKH